MASKTEIANLALSHIGSAKPVINVETDKNEEANAVRASWDVVRDVMLRLASWNFATAFSTLGLVAGVSTPRYAYAYELPSDFVAMRVIQSQISDEDDARLHYRIVGRHLYSNLDTVTIEYTKQVKDPGTWSPDFVEAFSYRLASYIAPRLAAGDPFKRGQLALSLYKLSSDQAIANNANEEVPEEPGESPSIAARR